MAQAPNLFIPSEFIGFGDTPYSGHANHPILSDKRGTSNGILVKPKSGLKASVQQEYSG
jgi:hypothetical protein